MDCRHTSSLQHHYFQCRHKQVKQRQSQGTQAGCISVLPDCLHIVTMESYVVQFNSVLRQMAKPSDTGQWEQAASSLCQVLELHFISITWTYTFHRHGKDIHISSAWQGHAFFISMARTYIFHQQDKGHTHFVSMVRTHTFHPHSKDIHISTQTAQIINY